MSNPPTAFVGVAVVLCFVVYRRARRAVSRRKVSRGFTIRAVLVSLITLGLLVALAFDAVSGHYHLLAGGVGGVVVGACLGVAGLRTAVFDREDGDLFVRTNRYISLTVVGLLVVRIAYRLFGAYSTMQTVTTAGPSGSSGGSLNGMSSYNDPWTIAVVGILLAYYAVTYGSIVYLDRTDGAVA